MFAPNSDRPVRSLDATVSICIAAHLWRPSRTGLAQKQCSVRQECTALLKWNGKLPLRELVSESVEERATVGDEYAAPIS